MKHIYPAPLFSVMPYRDLVRGLTPREIEKFKEGLSQDRYAVNIEFRELIEEKSRFIPKIFVDIE